MMLLKNPLAGIREIKNQRGASFLANSIPKYGIAGRECSR
jgi:hypothetical protein